MLVVVIIGVLIASCSKDDENPDPSPQVQVNLGDDTSIVEGSTVVLDAGNPGATYQWSTGESSQTIVVDTTGEYSVYVVNGDNSDRDTIKIMLQYNTIKVETDYGDFRMWLYHSTPLHRQNFLDLTTLEFYNNLIYHRVVYDFVIQGGDPEGTGFGGPGYTIPAEIVDGLNHDYGAIGAARLPDDENPDRESNGSQYYIVCDPDGEPGLDGNYTVFGTVFSGMESVFAISEVAVDTNQRPLQDVYMNTLTIENYTEQELKDLFDFDIPE